MYRKLFFVSVLSLAIFLNSFSQEKDTTKVHPIDEVTVSAYRTNSELGKIPQQLKVISQN